MRFAFCVHAHQPPGNFDWVFRAAVDKSYRPFFELLEAHPAMRVSAHFSGSLLEWLEANDGAFIDLVRGQVERGQVELVTAGLYEPVLALLPPHDRANQVLAHRAYLERLLGADTHVGWLTERVWQPELARDLASAGVRAVALDDTHFLSAGVVPEDLLRGPFITEHQGAPLVVQPASEEMRHLIPWRPVEEVAAALEAHAADGTQLLVFTDDIEKFGLWPQTYESVYGEGWLDRFFGAATALDGVDVVPLGEALSGEPPSRRVYIPDGSYPEMLRWTLPASTQRTHTALQERLSEAGQWDELKPLLRAGSYFQYLARYPEVNWLHKRMLDVSERVAARYRPSQVARDVGALPEPVRDLWRAQANCAYWHGLFGGTYLPHLRQTLWRHLLRAERALEVGGARRQPLRVLDLDADMRDEVLFTSETLIIAVAPGEGGAVVELSERRAAVNLLDTLARRPEAYHAEGDDAPYPYDRGRRACFVDRFLAPGAPPEVESDIEDVGEFSGRPYDMRVLRARDGARVVLAREASAPGGTVRVEKTLAFPRDGWPLRVEYRLTNVAGIVEARFGVEQNFGVFWADGEAGRYDCGLGDTGLREQTSARDASQFDLALDRPSVRVAVRASRPADLDVRPITTYSQSEAGVEWIPQSVACLFSWPLTLAPGAMFEVSFTLEVAGEADVTADADTPDVAEQPAPLDGPAPDATAAEETAP